MTAGNVLTVSSGSGDREAAAEMTDHKAKAEGMTEVDKSTQTRGWSRSHGRKMMTTSALAEAQNAATCERVRKRVINVFRKLVAR